MKKWSLAWEEDCKKWRGEILTGAYGHWCDEWDGLPVDMWTPEFAACECYSGFWFRLAKLVNNRYFRRLRY